MLDPRCKGVCYKISGIVVSKVAILTHLQAVFLVCSRLSDIPPTVFGRLQGFFAQSYSHFDLRTPPA